MVELYNGAELHSAVERLVKTAQWGVMLELHSAAQWGVMLELQDYTVGAMLELHSVAPC